MAWVPAIIQHRQDMHRNNASDCSEAASAMAANVIFATPMPTPDQVAIASEMVR